MGFFDDLKIITTRNGSGTVTGYREDLAPNDVISAALTSYRAITSVDWYIVGRPAFSAAGGAGPEPIYLTTAQSASFTVDNDSGGVRRDGTYILLARINAGAPNETEVTVALARTSGLTIATPTGLMNLRKLGGFESMEDTSISTIEQGWKTQLDGWLELLRQIALSGSSTTTLAQAYAQGSLSGDQTLTLLDAKGGGLLVDGSNVGFTGASAFRVNTAAGGPVTVDRATGRVGFGTASPAKPLHVVNSAPALRLDRTGGVALDIANVSDELQFLNGGLVLAKMVPTGGLRADLGVGIGTAPATAPVLALGAASAAAVSGAGTARIRYNESTGHAEWSENGSIYRPFLSAFSAYTTVADAGSSLAQRAVLNAARPLVATDNAGSSRTDLSLSIDATLAVSAGALGRAAISGDIVVSAGSSIAAFRNMTGTSVLARSAGTTGAPVDLAATVDGQVLQRLAGSLVWAALPTLPPVGPGDGVWGGSGIAAIGLDMQGRVTQVLPALFLQTIDGIMAGGDLAGSYPNPVIDPKGATTGQVLTWDGAHWNPATPTIGGITQLTSDVTAGPGTGSQVATISPHAVTAGKFRQSAASSVVGNQTSATADVADISATVDGQVLQRASGSLVFAALPYSSLTGAPTLFYQTVSANAVARTPRAILNFSSEFTVADNAGAGRTDVSVNAVAATKVTGLAAVATSGSASDLTTGTVAAARLGSFTNGSVMFWNGGLAQDNADLFWDVANLRLGVGTNAPSRALHVKGSTTANAKIWLENTAGGVSDYAELGLVNNGGAGARASIYLTSSTYTGIDGPNALTIQGATGGGIGMYTGTAGSMSFTLTNNGATAGDVQIARLKGGADALVYATAAAGQLGRVALGSGLSLSGGTLSATLGAFYQTIMGAGVPATQRSTLNFDGFFTVTDNAGAGRTDVSLANNAVTFGKFQSIAANSVLMNPTGSTASMQAVSLGTTSGVLQYINSTTDSFSVYAAGVGRIPFGLGSNGQLTDSGNLLFISNALSLGSSNASSNAIELTKAGVQQINKTGGTFWIGTSDANTVGLYSNNANRLSFDSTGALRLWSLATAGHLQTDASGNVSVDTTAYQAAISWPAATYVLRSAGSSATPIGSADLLYSGGVLVLGDGSSVSGASRFIATSAAGSYIAFWKDATPTKAAAIGNATPGTAPSGGIVVSTYDGSAWHQQVFIDNTGVMSVQSIAANSMVKTDGSHNLVAAVAGTDYIHTSFGTVGQIQNTNTTADPVWALVATAVSPGSYTNSNITVDAYGRLTSASSGSSGAAFYQTVQQNLSAMPQRGALNVDPNFAFTDDSAGGRTTLSLANGVGINGVTLPTNAALVVGHTTNGNRDRVQFFVGGGTNQDFPDTSLFMVAPTSTTIGAGAWGVLATERIKAATWTSSASLTGPTSAASLYIDGAPSLTGTIFANAYSIHVAGGQVRFDGGLRVSTLVGPGTVVVDSFGQMSVAAAGVQTTAALYYTVKIPGQGAGTPYGWFVTSTTLPGAGYAQDSLTFEYPTRIAAKTAVLTVIVGNNTTISNTFRINITRNSGTTGSGTQLGSGLTVGPSTTMGTVLTQTVTISGGALTDTYGVHAASVSGADTSGELDLNVSVVLTAQ